MSILRLCVLASAFSPAAAANVGAGDVGTNTENLRASHFVKAFQFQHVLRICNAYAYNGALDVYRVRYNKYDRLTEKSPMPYKSCTDIESPLTPGDKLVFKVGDASAGTFSVSELPNSDSMLMLVIHRHDRESTAVSFESHVFAGQMDNAQIAVIDTYKGSQRGIARIRDAPPKEEKNPLVQINAVNASAQPAKSTPPPLPIRSDELKYDSVVAVSPGLYEVVLTDENDDRPRTTKELVALHNECYVVMRTGVEAQNGQSFPEDIVVYPQSHPEGMKHPGSLMRRSGAFRGTSAAFLTAALVVAALSH